MQFRREVLLPCSASEAFDWHAREGAFERLAPPWDRLEILSKTGTGLEENSTILLQLRKLGFRKDWLAVISERLEGVYFKDVQVRGPFAKWEHKHAFKESDASTSILADEIEYALPGGSLANSFAGGHVQSVLEILRNCAHTAGFGTWVCAIRFGNNCITIDHTLGDLKSCSSVFRQTI